MDLLEATSNEKSMETNSSNEDVLVVLQTESGEQIALPVSALPSDFVPGDSGQIIMVESALDEQQQEVVVESSDTTNEAQQSNNTENLVSLHIETNNSTHQINTTPNHAITISNSTTTSNDVINNHSNEPTIIQLQPANTGDKPIPRTYSKNNVVKSYAPTCGTTRIYQQSQLVTLSQASSEPINSNGSGIQGSNNGSSDRMNDILLDKDSIVHNESMTFSNEQMNNAHNSNNSTSLPVAPSIPEVQTIPHKKQKRKETLLTRPINEEDMELEFQVVEESSPQVQEVEIKRKPRKEYRTKKKRLAMERLSKEEFDKTSQDSELREKEKRGRKQQPNDIAQVDAKEEGDEEEEAEEESKKEETVKEDGKVEDTKRENTRESKKEISRRELPRRGTKEKEKEKEKDMEKEKEKEKSNEIKQDIKQQQQPTQQSPTTPQTDRRTRLSNTCRVATGKSYKCNDCDFSTDRINNIILHMKESCPKLKK